MCISMQTVHAVAIRGRRNREGHVDRAEVPGSRSREPQQPNPSAGKGTAPPRVRGVIEAGQPLRLPTGARRVAAGGARSSTVGLIKSGKR